MNTQNTLPSPVIFSDTFPVPDAIYSNALLNSSDLSLLVALYKIRNDHKKKLVNTPWFFATNEILMKHTRISKTTLQRSRRKLAILSMIAYKMGGWVAKKKATRYLLMGEGVQMLPRQ